MNRVPNKIGSRRQFIGQLGAGFGSLALAPLLANAKPHYAAKAKRVIMLFMFGGPSHVDTFDYKPQLTKDNGKELPRSALPRVLSFPQQLGGLLASPWKFQRQGESGQWVRELFPELSGVIDDLCIIKSMHCTNPRHGGAVLEWHTGSDTFIRPSMGSWITYGLGSENENLPAYITIDQATSQGGANNFGSAFLPAIYQGTVLGGQKNAKFPFMTASPKDIRRQKLELEMLSKLAAQSGGVTSDMEARIKSFELAFCMQMEAPAALDLSQETAETQKLYGLNEKSTESFARQCLIARRLSERGVRFVQCNGNGWDAHSGLVSNHSSQTKRVDRPIAALIKDLKQRGLLDDTLVIWGGEFGRTPVSQNANGRDHNPWGFTMWMAGGGVRPGTSIGQTDEYGFYAAEDKVHFHDLHATILHLLGLDHDRLTYRYAGRDFRLTDIHGRIVKEAIQG
ncbi:MAG: sulfatase [Planctomycetaceae bacterium]|nr:sulfatase [Planctomycetaceae bacterium]